MKNIIVNTGHMEKDELNRFELFVENYFKNNIVYLYENNSNIILGIVKRTKKYNYEIFWDENLKKEPKKDIYFTFNNSGIEMYMGFENNIIKYPSGTFFIKKN